MTAATLPYIGSKISLISNSEIRYEGTLWKLDPEASTISLAKVRSFGTEDRRQDKVVPPRDDIYEFIIFRGTDIRDIAVLEPPQTDLNLIVPADPAIIDAQLAPSTTESDATRQAASAFSAAPGPSSAAPRFDRQGGHPRSDYHRNDNQRYDNSGEWNNNGYRGGRAFTRGGGAGYRGGRSNYGRGRFEGQCSGAPYRGHQDRQAEAVDEKVNQNPFDFDQANQALKEVEEKLKVVHGNDGDQDTSKHDEEPANFYDPQNFFDQISCEALEKQKTGQGQQRYDRQKEREINQLTFGISALPMNRSRSFQNQSRGRGGYHRGGSQGGYSQQQHGYSGGHGYNNNGGGYNNGFTPRRGMSQAYRRGGPRPQSQENVAAKPAAPRPKNSKKSPRKDNKSAGGDWVYDPKRGKWVNYIDPIKKRNATLLGLVGGGVEKSKGQSSRQQRGHRSASHPNPPPPPNRQGRPRRSPAKNRGARKSLVEVGCQNAGDAAAIEEDVGNRVKKMVTSGRNLNRDDSDKCSLRPTDADDWKDVSVKKLEDLVGL